MRLWKDFKKTWQNKAKPSRKEFHLIYGWASLYIPSNQRCPYVYVFRITPLPSGDALPRGVTRGQSLRRFIHENLLWEAASFSESATNQELIRCWDEIIPSATRLPTHRLEMGILRKNSGIPRSPFFTEYFCFLPFDGRASDKVAVRIAGFLASQLEDTQGFQGEALKSSKAYWLAAILAGWRRLK